MSGIVAVIPMRSFHSGKTRLAAYLSAGEREALIRAMFGHVISVARESGVLDRILVVSPDERVLRHVETLGTDVIAVAQEREAPGLNAAVTLGRERALADHASGVLVLFGDLPLITPDDVRNLVRRDAPLVIATDRHGAGTNALMLRLGSEAARAFTFHYGPNSRHRHVEEADRLGLDCVTAIATGTANDLDTIEDVERLQAEGRTLPFWLDLNGTIREEKSA